MGAGVGGRIVQTASVRRANNLPLLSHFRSNQDRLPRRKPANRPTDRPARVGRLACDPRGLASHLPKPLQSVVQLLTLADRWQMRRTFPATIMQVPLPLLPLVSLTPSGLRAFARWLIAHRLTRMDNVPVQHFTTSPPSVIEKVTSRFS